MIDIMQKKGLSKMRKKPRRRGISPETQGSEISIIGKASKKTTNPGRVVDSKKGSVMMMPTTGATGDETRIERMVVENRGFNEGSKIIGEMWTEKVMETVLRVGMYREEGVMSRLGTVTMIARRESPKRAVKTTQSLEIGETRTEAGCVGRIESGTRPPSQSKTLNGWMSRNLKRRSRRILKKTSSVGKSE